MTTNKLIKRLIDLTKEENTKEEKFYKAEIDGSLPFAAQQGKLSGMPSATPQAPGGLDQLPSEQRLYLTPDGKIPNTDSTPQDLKLHVYVGEQKGKYVDKKLIQRKYSSIYEKHHGRQGDDESIRFGGVIIDPKNGSVLMRQPSSEAYGNRWTLAKGGANEGETPEQAALREVEEETGMKCKVTAEIPGHYQSGKNDHKYYVMEVESTSKDLGDETSDVKWMSADEAYKTLDKLDNDAARRDKDAIAAGINEHNNNNKTSSTLAQVSENAKTIKLDKKEVFNSMLEHLSEHGEFPDDFSTNPKYSVAFEALEWAIIHPSDFKADSTVNSMSSDYMNLLDKKYGTKEFSDLHSQFLTGWKADALKFRAEPNLLNEQAGKMFNIPNTFNFSEVTPASVDNSGKNCYRSYEDKKAYVEAYQKFKTEGLDKIEGDGTNPPYHIKLSDGEIIDFENKVSFKVPDKKGGEATVKDAWKFRHMRDSISVKMEVSNEGNKKLATDHAENNYQDIGDRIHKDYDKMPDEQKKTFQDENGELLSKIKTGEKFCQTYLEHAQKLTNSVLNEVYPDTSHFYAIRKMDSVREVTGDFGSHGTPMTEEALDKLIDKAEKTGEGVKVNPHSAPLSGYTVDPRKWNGAYGVVRKLNKRDIVMHPALYGDAAAKAGNNHHHEGELVVLNNPDSESRLIYDGNYESKYFDKAKTYKGDWTKGPDTNGLFPTNIFGDILAKGLTNPSQDYHETLTPITTSDEVPAGKLGTNPGGTYKDSQGNNFYVKNDHEDKHASEQLANQFYKKLGFNVPETELVTWKDKTALKSKWLSGGKYHQGTEALQDQPDIKDGFLVDAVLANHDVIGAGSEKPYGNILEHEGKFYRLDQGGALEHKGLSGKKDNFHDWKQDYLPELDKFLDENVNPTTAHVFGGGDGMKDKWQTATDKLIQMKDSVIEDLVIDSRISARSKSHMIETLKRRRDNALKWVTKNHGVKYNSLEEIQNSTSLLKASDNDEDYGIDIFLDEPSASGRIKESKEERARIDKQFKELEDFYKTE